MSATPPYLHGHAASVLASHGWRSAANSAGYLLPHLLPDMDVLDVGCGPGTITVDLAELVPEGRVLGVDTSVSALGKAADLAVARDIGNVQFEEADIADLPYADASFDVVHAHQLLQHLAKPVAAIGELRRVLRPGGLIALRDADYGAMRWFPEYPQLDRWRELYLRMTEQHHHPDAGRRLLSWARQAGLTDVTASASTWCFAQERDREWWASTWADRVEHSGYAERALADGHADADELAELAAAWRDWAQREDGWFVVVHGEVLARG